VNNENVGDIGSISIYLGSDGLAAPLGPGEDIQVLSEPDIVYCGPRIASARFNREMSGGFDFDQDGFDDIVAANWNTDRQRGHIWLARGRAECDSIVCMSENDRIGQGINVSDLVGHGLAGLRLDSDDCAEVLASGYNGDAPDANNTGTIHIWRGAGGNGCPTETTHYKLHGTIAGDNIGFRLLAIGDMDGDGVGDIAVSSSGYGNTNIGAVLILSGGAIGQDIESLDPESDFSVNSRHIIGRISDPDPVPNTQFGYGMASLGDLNADGWPDFMVGARFSSISGPLRSGGAFVYLGSDDLSLLGSPDVIIAGQRIRADGEFGRSVAGGLLSNGGTDAAFFVGAPFTEREGDFYGELGAVFIGNSTFE